MDNEAKTKPVTYHDSVAGGRADALRHFELGFLVMLVTVYPPVSYGQTAVITGGADASGHTYSWQVHNGGASPIVEVRFSHYRGGLFFPPPGWSNDCTALVHVGAKDEPGVCTAQAAAPADGIAPGRSAAFSMQIAPAGAKRGPGEVTVRFADGNEARIAGVELPQQEGLGDKYVSLIALGAVFIIFVAVQAIRKRRPQVSRADEGRAEGTESR